MSVDDRLTEDRVLHRIPASDEAHHPNFQLEKWIREQGWSIGSSDVTGRRGIIFEEGVYIAKWKRLNLRERAECDAVAIGNGRTGPLVVVRQGPTEFELGSNVQDRAKWR